MVVEESVNRWQHVEVRCHAEFYRSMCSDVQGLRLTANDTFTLGQSFRKNLPQIEFETVLKISE
jgi:hypothetical protein